MPVPPTRAQVADIAATGGSPAGGPPAGPDRDRRRAPAPPRTR